MPPSPRFSALLALASACALQPASAQSVAPIDTTPATRRALALVDAINSGDSIRIRRWADTTYLPSIYPRYAAGIFDLYRRIQETSGGLVLERVTGDPWVMMNVRLRRNGKLARLGLGFEPGPGGKPVVSGWHAYPLADPSANAGWPTTRLADSAIRATIADHIGRSAARDEFSGVVRVLRGDTVFFEQGYGYAHRGFRVPNTPETRFHLGSQGKMFTAVAIAQLVEAKKLRFTDTLARMLPEYPNRDVANRVTIEQLLTHTSGLGFGPADDGPRPPDWRDASVSSRLPAYANESLAFAPGAQWKYSNAGYDVLAAVVERVSGERFHDYVRRHVWEPAGMTRTDWGVLDDREDDRAIGYGWFNDDPVGALARRPFWAHVGRRGGGSGGQFSTVGDLTRFAQAFRNGRLVSRAMADSLVTTRGVKSENYGYGMFTYRFPGADSVPRPSSGHGGGGANSGIDGGVFWFNDGRWTVAVLGNYDAPAAQNVIFRLMRFLARQ